MIQTATRVTQGQGIVSTVDGDLSLGARCDELLRRLRRNAADRHTRDDLAVVCQPWIEQLARRFQGRGEPLDDLIQVARLGLVKAIDRFDPARGVRFITYLTPIVLGEIKRHFRDNGWAMHVPRRLQELSLEVRAAVDAAYQELGRSPTVPEIAARTGLGADDVIEALETSSAYSLESLDAPHDDAGSDHWGGVGSEDDRLEMVEGWTALAPHLRSLSERERLILRLRFVDGMVQSHIAERLGISQMHVSRLLADIIRRLRAGLSEGG